MLYSVIVKVKSEKPIEANMASGKQVHGLFFRIMKELSPGMGDKLHSEEQKVQPFTVSTLNMESANSGWFRFTLFSNEMFDNIMDFLSGKRQKSIRIAESDFIITDFIFHDSEVANFATYDQLLKSAPLSHKIRLRFISATSFRHKGKNVPHPLPTLVFRSLLTKWNEFSPFRFDEEHFLTASEENVVTSRYKLQTRILDFNEYKIIGFTGSCEYTILSIAEELFLKQINTLADFAFYAGVGYKTTMGMGQTMRIDSNGRR